MTAAKFVHYFDELDRALAPELVSRNVEHVEWHGERPIGVLWPHRTRLLSGITTVRRDVHQGAFWVEGTATTATRDYPLRFPLLIRTVRLERDQNANPLLVNPGPWKPLRDGFDLDAGSDVAWIADPNADRAVRAVAAAYADTLDPNVYRVRIRTEYGLWAGDHSSATMFASATAPNLPDAFTAIYAAALKRDSEPESDAVFEPLATPVPLNPEQRFAVQQARDQPLTVISGPPGTGKTHTLSAILFEQLAKRRATLVVTATEPAREAIETMLAAHEALPIVRFGRDISPVVLGNALAERATSLRVQGRHRDLVKQLEDADATLADLYARALQHLRSSCTESTNGYPYTSAETRPSTRFNRAALLRWRMRRSPTVPGDNRTEDFDALLDRLWETERRRRAIAVEVFVAAYLASVKPAQRRDLAALARALRLDPMERRDALGSLDAGAVVAAPLWLGTLDSVDTFLPPVESMFDLVVFDEASQISQIDAVGALRRARRAAVVGDPHQMRHEARTSAAQRETAADAADLDETDRAIADELALSLYDVAASVAPVNRLVDHYRSSPHIIAFSNKHFYDGELRLMTRHPWRSSRDSIHLVPARPSVGSLARSQIDAAIATVRTSQEHGYSTVGLVVPDADNVSYAAEQAKKVLGADNGSMPRLRIGEPRSFQGIELDVIVIVTGLGQGVGAPLSTDRLAVFEDPNTLNTVITRARYDVYVVVDHPIEALPSGLWRSYLESESAPPRTDDGKIADDTWKQLIASETRTVADLPVLIDYRVGPHVIDLVVGHGRLAFGVFTGVNRNGPDEHIERYLALRELGWKIVHVLRQDWFGRDPDAVMEIIRRAKRPS